MRVAERSIRAALFDPRREEERITPDVARHATYKGKREYNPHYDVCSTFLPDGVMLRVLIDRDERAVVVKTVLHDESVMHPGHPRWEAYQERTGRSRWV
jgi:hypothetical protein